MDSVLNEGIQGSVEVDQADSRVEGDNEACRKSVIGENGRQWEADITKQAVLETICAIWKGFLDNQSQSPVPHEANPELADSDDGRCVPTSNLIFSMYVLLPFS